MGMVRLLTDIERLTTYHVPKWLETPGMSAAKIATFYDDPVKRACDDKALHDSEYRRLVSTETTPGWRLHRARIRVVDGLHGWRNRTLTSVNPRISANRSAASASLVPG
jgi:hypothetical protein